MKAPSTLLILVCINMLTAFGQQPNDKESDYWSSLKKYSEEYLTNYNANLTKIRLRHEQQHRAQSSNKTSILNTISTCNIITCGSFIKADVTPNFPDDGGGGGGDGSSGSSRSNVSATGPGEFYLGVDGLGEYAADVTYSCWNDSGTVDFSEGQYIAFSKPDAYLLTPAIISPSPDEGGFAIFSYQDEAIDQDLDVVPGTTYTVCFEIAVIPLYGDGGPSENAEFESFAPNFTFGISSGGIQLEDSLIYTHNDLTIHDADDFPPFLSTATSSNSGFQNSGGWTEIDPFWETICITFQSDASENVNVFFQTGNPGESVILVDGLRLSQEGYTMPPALTTSTETFCDDISVNLNEYVMSTGPSNAVLTWSTNADPLVLSDHLSDPTVTPPGTYYAFYYNGIDDCASPTISLDLILTDLTNTPFRYKSIILRCKRWNR